MTDTERNIMLNNFMAGIHVQGSVYERINGNTCKEISC